VATGIAFQAASVYFTIAPGTYQIRAVAPLRAFILSDR
jgi:hypothetical protein